MTCERTDWQTAHAQLSRLAKARAEHDFEAATWILAAHRTRPDRRLGFGSFNEYLERLFGWPPKRAQEKLRVAEALELLPAIAAALRDGVIAWSCVRELTRVAIAETEREWLEAARGLSMREVEELVSGRARGDRPGDLRDPKLERHVIRAEVCAEIFALWCDAISAVRKESGGTLGEDEIIRTVARSVFGGPQDGGRASYQIVLMRCPDCKRTAQRGSGRAIDVAAEGASVACAECDAQNIDLESPDTPAKQTFPPATRRRAEKPGLQTDRNAASPGSRRAPRGARPAARAPHAHPIRPPVPKNRKPDLIPTSSRSLLGPSSGRRKAVVPEPHQERRALVAIAAPYALVQVLHPCVFEIAGDVVEDAAELKIFVVWNR